MLKTTLAISPNTHKLIFGETFIKFLKPTLKLDNNCYQGQRNIIVSFVLKKTDLCFKAIDMVEVTYSEFLYRESIEPVEEILVNNVFVLSYSATPIASWRRK